MTSTSTTTPTTSTQGHRLPVTVIGLGPMGQATVRILLATGHPVTVWNRTPARADALVSEGAGRAETVPQALAASDVVLLSLTDYQAMDDILGAHTSALAGKTLVNLSSDTPERTRKAAQWASEHGAAFLTGGLMSPAPMLGTEDAWAYYSGPAEMYEHVRGVLEPIGTPKYVGPDPGAAQLLYQAQLDVFLTALAGLLHGTALAGAAGVSAQDFLPDALRTIGDIPAMIDDGGDLGRSIDAGDHPGDLSTTDMMGATADHIVGASRALGLDLALPSAVQHLYARAREAGRGQQNWTSLIEVIKPTSEHG